MRSTPNGVLPPAAVRGTVASMETGTLGVFAPRHKPPPLSGLQVAGLGLALVVVVVVVVALRLLVRDGEANRRRRLERAGDWSRAVRGWEAVRRAGEPKETREAPAGGPGEGQPDRLSYKEVQAMPAAERRRLLGGVRGRRP